MQEEREKQDLEGRKEEKEILAVLHEIHQFLSDLCVFELFRDFYIGVD